MQLAGGATRMRVDGVRASLVCSCSAPLLPEFACLPTGHPCSLQTHLQQRLLLLERCAMLQCDWFTSGACAVTDCSWSRTSAETSNFGLEAGP